jgi:hypothetical protein
VDRKMAGLFLFPIVNLLKFAVDDVAVLRILLMTE